MASLALDAWLVKDFVYRFRTALYVGAHWSHLIWPMVVSVPMLAPEKPTTRQCFATYSAISSMIHWSGLNLNLLRRPRGAFSVDAESSMFNINRGWLWSTLDNFGTLTALRFAPTVKRQVLVIR